MTLRKQRGTKKPQTQESGNSAPRSLIPCNLDGMALNIARSATHCPILKNIFLNERKKESFKNLKNIYVVFSFSDEHQRQVQIGQKDWYGAYSHDISTIRQQHFSL